MVVLCLGATAGSVVGCKASLPPETAFPDAPPRIGDLDDFEAGFNRLVLLDENDPQRSPLQSRLLAFLVAYIDRNLAEGDMGEAQSALKYAVSLYTPTDLRSMDSNPTLATRARELYRHSAGRGHEPPSLLALAIEQRFGTDAMRTHAVEEWAMLEQWMIENGPYADEPLLRHEELENTLEDVAAVFPSPFVTKRLADLYVARYTLARQARAQGRSTDASALRRMEITGYLILRAYLRADDIDGAAASSERVELDPPIRKLRTMMLDAESPRRSPLPLLALAEQFIPEQDADPSQPFVVQGWGIVDNLSRRAVDRFPTDPYTHLLRAKSLQASGLIDASMSELRRALDLKADLFDAWQALAQLQQEKLQRLADKDPRAAEEELGRVEATHQTAIKHWADRPLNPGLPLAFFTVAQGLYQVGDVEQAQALLERSLKVEPIADAIDLLGTIALKRSQLGAARERFESLAALPHDDELSQLRWEARAHTRLGEIAARRGNAAEANRNVRSALRLTNDVLARVQSGPALRASQYIDRGNLLFLLGDVNLAMDDYRRAAEFDATSIKTYADPLKVVVAHGYYDEARSIFRRAMAQDALPSNLKLYFCLWMTELAKRQNAIPEPDAERFIAEYKGSAWGQALAKHAQGKLSFEELLPRARDRGEKAEAYFYEGLRRWDDGDPSGWKTLMQEVIETNMMSFLEFEMAQAYLDWGEVPKIARAPVSATGPSATENRPR